MNHLLLCCQCGELFDENKKPIIGTCCHSICLQCYSKMNDSSDCPICGQESSFFGSLVDASILVKAEILREKMNEEIFKAMVNEKMKKLSASFCMLCAEDTGIKMRKCSTTNGEKWIIQYFSKENLFSDSLVPYADCVSQEHNEQTTLLISEISNLENVLGNEYVLKSFERTDGLQTIYEGQVTDYRKYMEIYEAFTTGDTGFGDIEGLSDELKQLFDESRQRVRQLVENVIKLKQRELQIEQDNLQMSIDHFVETSDTEEFEKELARKISMNILNNFLEITSEFQFSQKDLDEIDRKVTQRMEELEESYKKGLFLEIETDSKFYKYQALMQELGDIDRLMTSFQTNSEDELDIKINDELEKLQKIEEAMKETKKAKESMDPKEFINQMDQFRKFSKFLHMELFEMVSEKNKSLIQILGAHERYNYAHLMHLKYFRETPEEDSDDAAFSIFIKGFESMKCHF